VPTYTTTLPANPTRPTTHSHRSTPAPRRCGLTLSFSLTRNSSFHSSNSSHSLFFESIVQAFLILHAQALHKKSVVRERLFCFFTLLPSLAGRLSVAGFLVLLYDYGISMMSAFIFLFSSCIAFA